VRPHCVPKRIQRMGEVLNFLLLTCTKDWNVVSGFILLSLSNWQCDHFAVMLYASS
jgi:hypothetical protein